MRMRNVNARLSSGGESSANVVPSAAWSSGGQRWGRDDGWGEPCGQDCAAVRPPSWPPLTLSLPVSLWPPVRAAARCVRAPGRIWRVVRYVSRCGAVRSRLQ